MKYLIFGGTGSIGSRVTERLVARGERPSVFVRNAKKVKALFGDQVDIHVGTSRSRVRHWRPRSPVSTVSSS